MVSLMEHQKVPTNENQSAPSPLWIAIHGNGRHDGATKDKGNENGHDSHQTKAQTVEELLKKSHDPNEDWNRNIAWQKQTDLGSYMGTVAPAIGVDMRRNDPFGTTPLLAAVVKGETDVVETLLQYGANLESKSGEGTTALHEALIRPRHEQGTSEMHASKKKSNSDLVSVLLKYGADTTMRTSKDRPFNWLPECAAIHIAVAYGRISLVKLLISQGIDLSIPAKHGWTAIDIAIIDHQVTVLELLLPQLLNGISLDHDADSHDSIAKENTERANLAHHVLTYGLHRTNQRHKMLFDQCLKITFSEACQKTSTYGIIARKIVDRVDQLLKKIAGIQDPLLWDRNLCQECILFQSQDFFSITEPFDHKQDLASLLRSVQDGCQLCYILERLLHSARPDMNNRAIDEHDRQQLAGSTRVRLAVKLQRCVPQTRLLLGCDGRTSVVELNDVDEQMHAAICRTRSFEHDMTPSLGRSLANAKAWLEACESEHRSCPSSQESTLPTRVIDVGTHLQEPSLSIPNGEKGRYVALSYCWGLAKNLETRKENLLQHLNGLSLQQMPHTVQDAIKVTRSLDIRYLWVDALCIVQDDEDDFSKEASKMGTIFGEATLTIVVKDAKSCSDGFLQNKLQSSFSLFPLDFHVPMAYELSHTTAAQRISTFHRLMVMTKTGRHAERKSSSTDDSLRSVYDTRGWTLQEEVLSRRVLYCWSDEFVWNCFDRVRSESDPNSYGDRTWSGDQRKLIYEDIHRHTKYAQGPAFREWLSIAEHYSTRIFTKPGDKLIALIGLQDRFSNKVRDVPLGGCWRDHFFWPSLLWICLDAIPKAGCRLEHPSWSWTSTHHAIQYLQNTEFLRTSRYAIEFLPEVKAFDLDVVRANIILKGSILIQGLLLREEDLMVDGRTLDPHQSKLSQAAIGIVLTRSLRGCYPVTPESLRDEEEEERRYNELKQQVLEKQTAIAKEYEDHPHRPIGESWYLILGARERKPRELEPGWICQLERRESGQPADVLLMHLEKLHSDQECYRRIGLATAWDREEWRERAISKDIKLF